MGIIRGLVRGLNKHVHLKKILLDFLSTHLFISDIIVYGEIHINKLVF